MNIVFSNILATSIWVAFLSVSAIVGIIVAGGFIIALLGKMVLSVFTPGIQDDVIESANTYNYTQQLGNDLGAYLTQNEEAQQHVSAERPVHEVQPEQDYSYALDVDDDKAKLEADALNNELKKSVDDDFFKDFAGDQDQRFGDDDLMGMIDEISHDVLDEEDQSALQSEQQESLNNQSILNNYSIDNFFNEQPEEENEDNLAEEPIGESAQPIYEQGLDEEVVEEVLDERTITEINALKDQVSELVESMEASNNRNQTFNEQLIEILNELKEANNKTEVATEEDAEREINDLKRQLEESRIEMERQLQQQMAYKDAEMQERLQEQLAVSNAEMESLKAQLSELLRKMEKPDEEPIEVESVIDEKTMSEINALKDQVNVIMESMEENKNQNQTFNEQLINILNEIKESNNKVEVETEEDAEREINDLKRQLEESRLEMARQFQEQMAYKDNQMQLRLQEQFAISNAEMQSLKAELSGLLYRMEEPDEEPIEVEPVIDEQTMSEINALKDQVNVIMESMEESKNQNQTFNEQLNDILNEMKEAKTRYEIETQEDAEREINEMKRQLEESRIEMERQFQEQMAHKDAEMQTKLQEQMAISNAEIESLKEQLIILLAKMEEPDEEPIEVEPVIDEQTMNEVNALKDQVKEIVESMEENKNQNQTFNEQLIEILNELKESNNKREVETQEDAEREINDLKRQLEESRQEMERQLQEKIAYKDAEMQARLQEQMAMSNAEMESLKAQLTELLYRMEEPDEEPLEVESVIDEETANEINALKQQVKEIVESMEENNNKSQTFNEQLIEILNELKNANNKAQVETQEDAEREVNDLKRQLEESRLEMARQFQEQMAHKDAEMQTILQEQMAASNAEIESLKEQLTILLAKMEEPDEEPIEVEPMTEEESEIAALRSEVKELLDDMRKENDAKTSEFNEQLIEILNEMKAATLKQSEQIKIDTAEEAVEEIDEWQAQLEAAQKEMEKQFKEELLHKTEEEKAELRAQMASYSDEVSDLKEQLANLLETFKQESESSKAKNQALIDELEAERQIRIALEKEKLDNEKAQQEQLENLRKENEMLADKLQSRAQTAYEPLTEDEMDDLYSEATTIDYAAINQMNEEQIDKKVKAGLEQSKIEIDELKEQISRLTSFIETRDQELAGQLNVHEVRAADFDVEKIKEITTREVEAKVKEKLAESLAEIETLKHELVEAKKEVENQYKEQLANIEAGMEYDRVSKLQETAERVQSIDTQLKELTESLKEEKHNTKQTSKECAAEIEESRENKTEEAKQIGFEDSDVAVIGPKNNKVALISSDMVEAEKVEGIDYATVKELTEAEIEEMVEKRMQVSNKEIDSLKEQIAQLRADLARKDEEIKAQAEASTVPVVRSPLFDVEMIKNITAQEVEQKVQERLNEAMKEIEEMKRQLEESKKEIERQYKEEIAKNHTIEAELKEKLKSSAAEVIELKGQLADLTEQIEIDHQEARENSEKIAEQLEQDRKEKEEIARQHFAQLDAISQDTSIDMAVVPAREVTVIGPKNNQVALVTGAPVIAEEIGEYVDDIPTIDIEAVKKLTEAEIEEKVEQRMTSSIIEIEELKKQILNLSIQIQELKEEPDEDEKPTVFHYSTEEAYLERLAVLEERLKVAKKDLKINAKELNPLEKVNRTLERDKIKLRRKDAIAAKKKVALYGVKNYVDIDREKAEKLAQELELLDGLRLSVKHCEEVMNANIERYPILLHTNKILKENIANIESDIAMLNKELQALREKNGSSANN